MGSRRAVSSEATALIQQNPTLALIERRSSTRCFKDKATSPGQITEAQRAAVLHAASRAPSAGAMMLYSVISIQRQETLDELARLCDNQPFIATAPWALVFVADYCKWIDLFCHTGCFELDQVGPAGHRPEPGSGELLLAAQDAMAAAQTAVIAAEAVGLGSCYIGDILENAEQMAALLDLPKHTVPLSMLVLGVPAKDRPQTPHPTENLVMDEKYRRAGCECVRADTDCNLLDCQAAEQDRLFRPHGAAHGEQPGVRVRDLYVRKHTSDFMAEMCRSADAWLENWTGEKPLRED